MSFIGPGSEWFWTALQQLQIRDNTKVLRTQAHDNALLLAQRPFEMLIDNESLAKVVNVGYATPDALSADDWARCGYYYFMQFNAWEYLYYQNRDGSIPKELWVGADAFFKSLVATKPGLKRFWSEFEASFDEPFRTCANGEVFAVAGEDINLPEIWRGHVICIPARADLPARLAISIWPVDAGASPSPR
jgi:hypothetical protein